MFRLATTGSLRELQMDNWLLADRLAALVAPRIIRFQSDKVSRAVRRYFASSGRGSLAQLVEQRTLNPLVEGSIPSRPTNGAASRESGHTLSSCGVPNSYKNPLVDRAITEFNQAVRGFAREHGLTRMIAV